MATIQDVARRAGVSQRTASRVFRDDPTVTIPVRRAVQEAMRELGYVPNRAATTYRTARSRAIGLVIGNPLSTILMEVVAGIDEVVRRHGYSLLVSPSWGTPEQEMAAARDLLGWRVEGLILWRASVDESEILPYHKAGVPIVVLGPHDQRPMQIPKTEIFALLTVEKVYRYLRNLGHTRVANVLWRGRDEQRLVRALLRVARAAGTADDRFLIASSLPGRECADQIVALLRRPDRPTAIVTTPAFAADTLVGIREAGLRVPDDVSVLSIGDPSWSLALDPPLTVVRTDARAVGIRVADYLFSLLAGAERRELLEAEEGQLVIRGSCRDIGTPEELQSLTAGRAK